MLVGVGEPARDCPFGIEALEPWQGPKCQPQPIGKQRLRRDYALDHLPLSSRGGRQCPQKRQHDVLDVVANRWLQEQPLYFRNEALGFLVMEMSEDLADLSAPEQLLLPFQKELHQRLPAANPAACERIVKQGLVKEGEPLAVPYQDMLRGQNVCVVV